MTGRMEGKGRGRNDCSMVRTFANVRRDDFGFSSFFGALVVVVGAGVGVVDGVDVDPLASTLPFAGACDITNLEEQMSSCCIHLLPIRVDIDNTIQFDVSIIPDRSIDRSSNK
jgi:hypothetical protein